MRSKMPRTSARDRDLLGVMLGEPYAARRDPAAGGGVPGEPERVSDASPASPPPAARPQRSAPGSSNGR